MPVIVPPDRYNAWLDPSTPVAELKTMLMPYSAENMRAFPVSTYVNSPGREGAECIEPLVADGE
jgi:putative SOS response-associated peptidase YedK